MSVEVIAVRYACDWGCDLTVICAEGRLPPAWFEMPPPPWRAHHQSRHVCPNHAPDARRLHHRQWAAQRGRTHIVSAEEFEAAKAALRHASVLVDRLKFSGERVDGREV